MDGASKSCALKNRSRQRTLFERLCLYDALGASTTEQPDDSEVGGADGWGSFETLAANVQRCVSSTMQPKAVLPAKLIWDPTRLTQELECQSSVLSSRLTTDEARL
eukprot:1700580-Pyramimonas_sp.AAC.1